MYGNHYTHVKLANERIENRREEARLHQLGKESSVEMTGIRQSLKLISQSIGSIFQSTRDLLVKDMKNNTPNAEPC